VNSGVRRVRAQILGTPSHEDARLRRRDRIVSAFHHIGYRELEARGLGIMSSEVAIEQKPRQGGIRSALTDRSLGIGDL
jgi:hypothetical protein